ncbi:MAG: methyltransferase domain-containing protein [Ruminococcaceae bacterium]|nr:methyltransferase domain-containing protein [Oscillospiraceae bacterium]
MYICPKCSQKLIRNENTYKCELGHSYDIASAGYVNLILSSKKSAVHGDNKEMIDARRRFLSLGHYSAIPNILFDLIRSYINDSDGINILDAGCGEGYYTGALADKCSSDDISANIYGVDVSKDAVLPAAKRYKSINFAVASVNALPFANERFDVVLSLFAPLAEKEFHRVLKNGGILITVSPSPRHLFGLKEKIYDTPYLNPITTFEPEILTKANEIIHSEKIHLSSQNEIQDLFKMTPYYYNTGKKDIEKLSPLSDLDTEIGFVFGIYRKYP